MHQKHIQLNTKITHMRQTWLTTSFLSKTLRYHLPFGRWSYLFFFMTRVVLLLHTNRPQYSYAIGASFRSPFQKRTNYFAKHHYRKFFHVKLDRQILVVRRHPSGIPLTASPVYAFPRPPPLKEVSVELDLFVESRRGKIFRRTRCQCFPVGRWGFQVFEPRIRVPHVELSIIASKLLTLSILAGNVLLTCLPTD
jgi:hypothetical protein